MAYIRVFFSISTTEETLDINEVKDDMSVSPSQIWKKRDPIIVNGVTKNKTRIESCWEFEIEKETNDLGEILSEIIPVIENNKNSLTNFSSKQFEIINFCYNNT